MIETFMQINDDATHYVVSHANYFNFSLVSLGSGEFRLHCMFMTSNGWKGVNWTQSSSQYPFGTTHLGCRYDPDTFVLNVFLNGYRQIGQGSYAIITDPIVNVTQNPTYIGCQSNSFSGTSQLDEFRMWSRPRQDTEILMFAQNLLVHHPDFSFKSSLAHRWTFDGPSCSTTGTGSWECISSNNASIQISRIAGSLSPVGVDSKIGLNKPFLISLGDYSKLIIEFPAKLSGGETYSATPVASPLYPSGSFPQNATGLYKCQATANCQYPTEINSAAYPVNANFDPPNGVDVPRLYYYATPNDFVSITPDDLGLRGPFPITYTVTTILLAIPQVSSEASVNIYYIPALNPVDESTTKIYYRTEGDEIYETNYGYYPIEYQASQSQGFWMAAYLISYPYLGQIWSGSYLSTSPNYLLSIDDYVSYYYQTSGNATWNMFFQPDNGVWGLFSFGIRIDSDYGSTLEIWSQYNISGVQDAPFWTLSDEHDSNGDFIQGVAESWLSISSANFQQPLNQKRVLDDVIFSDPDMLTSFPDGYDTVTNYTVTVTVDVGKLECVSNATILAERGITLVPAIFTGQTTYTIFGTYDAVRFALYDGIFVWDPNSEIGLSGVANITWFVDDQGWGPINGSNPMNASFAQNLTISPLPSLYSSSPEYVAEYGKVQLTYNGSNIYNSDLNFAVLINGSFGSVIFGSNMCYTIDDLSYQCYIDDGPSDIVDTDPISVDAQFAWRILNPYSQQNRSDLYTPCNFNCNNNDANDPDPNEFTLLTSVYNVTTIFYPVYNTTYWSSTPSQLSMFGGDLITGTTTVPHLYTGNVAGFPKCRLVFSSRYPDYNGTYYTVYSTFDAIANNPSEFQCLTDPFPQDADASSMTLQYSQNGIQFYDVSFHSGLLLSDQECYSVGELYWKQKERIDSHMDYFPSLVKNGTVYYNSTVVNFTASDIPTFTDGNRCCPSYLTDGNLCGINFNQNTDGVPRSQYAGLDFGANNAYINMVITSHGDPCNNLPSPYRLMYLPANGSTTPIEILTRDVSNSQQQCKIVRGESGPTAICVDLIRDIPLVKAVYFEFLAQPLETQGAIMEFDARGLLEFEIYDFNIDVSPPLPPGSPVFNSSELITVGDMIMSPRDAADQPLGSNLYQNLSIVINCFYHPTIGAPISGPGWTSCGASAPVSSVPPGNVVNILAGNSNGTWANVTISSPPKGSYVLNMTAPELYRTIPLPYTVVPGSVHTMKSSSSSITVSSDDTFTLNPVNIVLTDAGLNALNTDPANYPPISEINVTVAFYHVSNNSLVSSNAFDLDSSITSLNTSVSGVVSFQNLTFHNASSGTFAVLTFSSPGLVSITVKVNFVPGSPTHLVFDTIPPTTHDNSGLAAVPIVYMADSAGNKIKGLSDFITATFLPIDGKPICTTAGTAKNTDPVTGLAVFSGLGFQGQRDASYFIRFTLNSDTSVQVKSAPITVEGCVSGSELPDDSCSCTCNFGHSRQLDTTICVECPQGFYKDEAGFDECYSCSERRSTADPGSTSLTECLCETGYYQDPNNIDDRTASSCLLCPVGAVCPGVSGNITDIDIFPEPGYWADSADPYTIFKCTFASACLGGQNSECLTGYDGPTCAVCAPGYGSFGLRCSACDVNQALNWSMVVVFFFLVFGAAIYLVKTANSARSKASVYVRQAITFLQFLALCASLNVREWPSGIITLFSVSNVAMVDIGFLSTECTLEIDYYQTFLLYCLLPVLMILIPVTYLGVVTFLTKVMPESMQNSRRRQISSNNNEFGDSGNGETLALDISDDDTLGVATKEDQTRKIISQSVALVTILINLTYPGTSKRILSIFDCSPYGNDKYLTSNLEVKCGTPQHQFWTVVAYFMLFFYCVGVPLAFWYILWRNKDRHNDPAFRQRFNTLYDGYKPQFYYHESILMFRKLLFVVIIAFLRNQTQFQTYAALASLIAFTLHTTWAQPYEDQVASKLELLGLFLLYLTVTMAQMLYFQTLSLTDNVEIVLVIATLIIGATIIYLGYILVYVLNYRIRQYFPDVHEKAVMALSRSLSNVASKVSRSMPNLSRRIDKLNTLLLDSQIADVEERAEREEKARKRRESREKFSSKIKTLGRRKSIDNTNMLADGNLDVPTLISPSTDVEMMPPPSSLNTSSDISAPPPLSSGIPGLSAPPSLSGTNISPRN